MKKRKRLHYCYWSSYQLWRFIDLQKKKCDGKCSAISYEIVKAKYASKRGQKQTRLDSAEREHTRPKVKYTKK